MKLIYFDLCSIPIFLLIIYACFVRRMTTSRAERLFLMVNVLSLICAVLDIWMEYVVNPVPITEGAAALGMWISFTYKLLHNLSFVFYLLFVFVITRTLHRLRSRLSRIAVWTPFIVLAVFLVQNFFTRNMFTVTAEGGYSRGPLLILVYIVAGIYGFAGMFYTIYCRKYLENSKWAALLSVYLLIFAAVIAEFFYPRLLVEMFAIAVGVLLVLNLVMRPEETMDGYVVIRTRRAYENDLRNSILSGDNFQIVIVQMENASEIRSYLGEHRYYTYMNEIVDEIRQLYASNHIHIEMYFERPGIIYLILDDPDFDVSSVVSVFIEGVYSRTKEFMDMGVQFEPRICTIRCPEEMGDSSEILELGRTFTMLGSPDRIIYSASELKKHPDFNSIVHMDEILNRAMTEDSLKVLYQPIYNVREKRFDSAEALSRLVDRVYGTISPALFIPAAEANGLILSLGEKILESVFRFISANDMDELGLSTVEINLSIAQMLQPKLPEVLRGLQEKYSIDPARINFEITESMFDNLSDVIVRNVDQLSEAGYSFSLDDYGTGYSSLQRMSKYPMRLVKIDKSMTDEVLTDSGNVIMLNTIRMMHDIHKKLVVEGVETEDAKNAVSGMSCDYIQGFYYSKPLAKEDLIEFLRTNMRTAVVS
ncbi:MAG: EAL domain-containing protein [Mogibacterium sp.]|nr:EAL domain-containing protein [Mogibacterium sp.]